MEVIFDYLIDFCEHGHFSKQMVKKRLFFKNFKYSI